MRRQVWIAGSLLLAGGMAGAAQSPLEAAQRCAAVQDSLQRLVCYDSLFASGASAAAAAAPAAPVTPPAAPVAPPAPPVVAAAPAEAEFGRDQAGPAAERKREREAEVMNARISELKEIRPNTWLFTLDNDQVWQQLESDRYFVPETGAAVVIRKGILGGYQLEPADGGRRIRVNRLK